MLRPDKVITTSVALSTKSSNNKQKASFAITDISNQDFRKFLKKFKNEPYIGYKIKQVHNEPTESYFFLIKRISKLLKGERHVRIRTNFIKYGANETIGHVNEAIKPK